MGKKNTIILLLLPLMSVLLSPGCATLTRKRTQRIPVTSSPVGATIIVNGQQQGVTPLEIRLVRKKKGQVIRIESPGYNPFEIQLTRKLSGIATGGNILLGAITGAAFAMAYALNSEASFDFRMPIAIAGTLASSGIYTLIDSGGKGNVLKPADVTVALTKADGRPRVDTMLVDLYALKNIKWIRVQRD